MKDKRAEPGFDAWNPGMVSGIPRDLLPQATIFRPENIANTLQEIEELSHFSGISPFELAAFRPERLIAHEILIRVSADLTVPDGPNYEDLGINMRSMATTMLDEYIKPEMGALCDTFVQLDTEVREFLHAEIERTRSRNTAAVPPGTAAPSLFSRLFRRPKPLPAPASTVRNADPLSEAVDGWASRAEVLDNSLHAACLDALASVANTVLGTRGRVVGDTAILVELAAIRVLNTFGSCTLGNLIDPIVAFACEKEGYRFLPPQAEPCIMNVKGASASGKSTTRSLQRQLAERIGVPWEDFAVISPDYWRKFLLDYGSLGDAYKYAGALTSHELAIVDRKLDGYVGRKAEAGEISHLLIDRFRFDSFSPAGGGEADSKLLTRFGKTVFLFFMVTPPEATVERAWVRGLQTGRYKAVDDLLFHNIEAFEGMPQLFFSWAFSKAKRVHFEFLDNSVPKGERPITIASGWNRALTVFDVEKMLDIERYKKIDTGASGPDEVYQPEARDDAENTAFLRQCVTRLDRVEFVDPRSRITYGIAGRGAWSWIEPDASLPSILHGLGLDWPTKEHSPAFGSSTGMAEEAKMEFNVGRLGGKQ